MVHIVCSLEVQKCAVVFGMSSIDIFFQNVYNACLSCFLSNVKNSLFVCIKAIYVGSCSNQGFSCLDAPVGNCMKEWGPTPTVSGVDICSGFDERLCCIWTSVSGCLTKWDHGSQVYICPGFYQCFCGLGVPSAGRVT